MGSLLSLRLGVECDGCLSDDRVLLCISSATLPIRRRQSGIMVRGRLLHGVVVHLYEHTMIPL